ncbi:hypothetical protein V9L05_01280 [Bernardetia sp. Wsw4-3y2]|uniref:hypothetical protein n=1 Tax=Bernardetia sp. Wsw4-3y2 TaxID=3127471 RepID=UPI0030D6008B
MQSKSKEKGNEKEISFNDNSQQIKEVSKNTMDYIKSDKCNTKEDYISAFDNHTKKMIQLASE